MQVLIVANASFLRDGVAGALVSFPDTETVTVDCDERLVLEALQAAPPDLLILDAGSVSNNPAQILRAIKQHSPAVPCIVLVDRPAEAQPVRAAGADQVLVKGFSLTELAALVRQFHGPAAGEHSG